MSDHCRITRIFLTGPAPFHDCEFDLTDAETGNPLDSLCLFGPNGTGKAMLLRQLRASAEFRSPRLDNDAWSDSLVVTEFVYDGRKAFQARPGSFDEDAGANILWLHESFGEEDRPSTGFSEFHDMSGYLQIGEDDIPPKPAVSQFDNTTSDDLSEFLAKIARSREEELCKALRSPENSQKTVVEIESAFKREHRDLFQELGAFWSRTIPGLASELASDGDFMTKLARFEPGIRRLLLQTGSLLRDREEDASRLLFLDCPENGLDPATAVHALEVFRAATEGSSAQIFVTTDSPLIAAQFEPGSRFRLEKTENGILTAMRGEAPEGADPTQMLKRDFGLPGKNALENQKAHGELAGEHELDEDDLADLIDAASWRRKS